MPFSQRVRDALCYAFDLHHDQVRKDTDIPYVTHLMSVASLVAENGGDEEQVIAGLLHDAVEDQGGEPRLAEIRERFGPRVAAIVESCTDTDVVPKPPWRARKEAYVAHLAHAPPDALLVSLADKVHNARSIAADLRQQGPMCFKKFKGGREGTLWYYQALLAAFTSRDACPALRHELARCVEEMLRLAGAARPEP